MIEANLKLSEHAHTLEQLAVSRERNRLARELHDTLAHTLSSQILTLEAMRISANPEDKELIQSLDQLIQNTRSGLTETRRALKDLRSKKLEDLGLSGALKNLVADAAGRANCAGTSTISENLPALSTKTEQCMLRIAQEALENIARHANASNIELKLVQSQKKLILEISDDGQGFNQASIDKRERMGIRGMIERAAEAGGILKIITSPEKGTSIRVEFGE